MHDETGAERLAATLLAHGVLFEALAGHVFSSSDEPIEEAEALRAVLLRSLEDGSPNITDRADARLLQGTIDKVEAVFERIIEDLAEAEQPIAVARTAYGLRLAASLPPADPHVASATADARPRGHRRWRWPRS